MRKSLLAITAGAALLGLTTSMAHAASLNLGVTLKLQERSNWCWNATAQMIMEYRGRFFSEQCEIAELARSIESKFGSIPCCLDPDGACNETGSHWLERTILGYQNITTSEIATYLSYADAKAQLGANNPFIVGWWWTGGAHVAVVDGYADASSGLPDRLQVVDPQEGKSLMNYATVRQKGVATWGTTISTFAAYTPADVTALFSAVGLTGTSQNFTSATSVGAMNDQASSAAVRGVPHILYEHGNYTGMAWPVTPNNYSSYTSWNGTNDSISSIKQVPGTSQAISLVLFEGENYSGAHTLVTTHNPDLHALGWGDRVSSLIVVSKIWNLYSNTVYGGLAYGVTSFGGPNRDGFYPNPASWGGSHDDASSVRYVQESSNPVILYSGVDFTGRALVIWPAMDASALSVYDFNDATSSIKTYGGTWTVYRANGSAGASYPLGPNAFYRTASEWGGLNDDISSATFSDSGAWWP